MLLMEYHELLQLVRQSTDCDFARDIADYNLDCACDHLTTARDGNGIACLVGGSFGMYAKRRDLGLPPLGARTNLEPYGSLTLIQKYSVNENV
jgi:hypothetical protein